MRTILLCALISQAVSAEFVRLESGKQAKASEVNGNFEYLAARLDSLVKALGAKDDSLKALAARVDSVKQDLGSFAKGAVAGFLVAPDGDGYLPGSNKTWLLAGGQGETNGVKVPDLRGVFLRGMELDKNIANTPTGYAMRDSSMRKVGEFQSDAFQGHWHQAMVRTINDATDAPSCKGQQNDRPIYNNAMVRDAVTDSIHGKPRIASETRPKNVAVYWYVKVK